MGWADNMAAASKPRASEDTVSLEWMFEQM
jgi:hypothetical protein